MRGSPERPFLAELGFLWGELKGFPILLCSLPLATPPSPKHPQSANVSFSPDERELLEMVAEDIPYIAAEAGPSCTDHQLRRISVQLRNLVIYDHLLRCWRLLNLEPKQPIIKAARLRTDGFDANAVAVAAGGEIGGMRIANATMHYGRAMTPEEVKRDYEQGLMDIEFPFKLSDYKMSCAIFVGGKRINRQQVIAYVANKKGGAHLDASRKKDEEACKALDDLTNFLKIGGYGNPTEATIEGGKNVIYMELLSIGQSVSSSPDVLRLVDECKKALSG